MSSRSFPDLNGEKDLFFQRFCRERKGLECISMYIPCKGLRFEVGRLLLLLLLPLIVLVLLSVVVAPASHPLCPLLPRLVHLLSPLFPLRRAAPLAPVLRPRPRPLRPPPPRRRARCRSRFLPLSSLTSPLSARLVAVPPWRRGGRAPPTPVTGHCASKALRA